MTIDFLTIDDRHKMARFLFEKSCDERQRTKIFLDLICQLLVLALSKSRRDVCG